MFDLKLGFKCNNNCKHCVVANKRIHGNLDMPHILFIIKNIPKEETRIQITGGEPSIFKTLPDILKICKERQLFTVVQSNGTGFSNLDFAKACAPYLDQLHIAIHSCFPEIHDTIVESNGMWEKTISGFKNMDSLGVYITTQTVLSKYNIDSLYDTFSFIQNLKPGIKMSMTYPHIMGNAWTNKDEIAFRYSDYKDIIQKTLKSYKKYIFSEAIPPCYLYPNFPDTFAEKEIIAGKGNYGIDFSSSYNIINYNKTIIKDYRKAPKCKECIFNTKCIGVWKEYIEIFKNNLDLYPIKENKECSDLQIT